MPYFDEPLERVKIQTTSKNTQRYYTTKRLIRDLLSNMPNCFMSVLVNFADIYLRGMCDRSMQSGMELAWEIQLTDWSTAGEQGKLVFVVLATPSLVQFISLFTTGKNRLWIVQITHQFNFFTLTLFSVKKKCRNEIRFEKPKFFS